MTTALNPRILQPHDIEPNWQWDRHLPALGHTAVDFERRVDHERLRRYRLSRAKQALKNSKCGALLLFDVNNIRYVTGTKIGEWERDKMCRFALLAGDVADIVDIEEKERTTIGVFQRLFGPAQAVSPQPVMIDAPFEIDSRMAECGQMAVPLPIGFNVVRLQNSRI